MLVPPLDVPCQYIVPPEPPEALNVAFSHMLPPPVTVTAAGAPITVTVLVAETSEHPPVPVTV